MVIKLWEKGKRIGKCWKRWNLESPGTMLRIQSRESWKAEGTRVPSVWTSHDSEVSKHHSTVAEKRTFSYLSHFFCLQLWVPLAKRTPPHLPVAERLLLSLCEQVVHTMGEMWRLALHWGPTASGWVFGGSASGRSSPVNLPGTATRVSHPNLARERSGNDAAPAWTSWG